MLSPEELAEAKARYALWAEGNPHAGDPLLAFLAGWQICDTPAEYPGINTSPQDRLTRLCDIAVKAIRASGEGIAQPQLVMMLQDGKEGAIEVSGYRDSLAALPDLIRHTNQLLKAHGIDLNEIFADVDIGKLFETGAPSAFKRREAPDAFKDRQAIVPPIDRHIRRLLAAKRQQPT
jgi:hypothetical protein